MGIRDELINEIQGEIKTGGTVKPYHKGTRLGAEQARSVEKQLTGSTDYGDNKGEVLKNICEAMNHNERKDLRATQQLSVEALKKVRESLQQA
jgi:hypothetical protein